MTHIAQAPLVHDRAQARQPRPTYVPRATYRLQFNRHFRFADASALVPYLHQLGISDLYASPLCVAQPGSAHGYDVTDHTQLNPELGTEDDFNHLCATLKQHAMGLLVDVVPNHMAVATDANRWWSDVLENGPSSAYAKFFDIDWQPPRPDLAHKVLLPILEDQYGKVLESGKLQLQYAEERFVVCYGDRRLPVAPKTWTAILHDLRATLASEASARQALDAIMAGFDRLPSRTETDAARLAQRQQDKEHWKTQFAALVSRHARVRQALQDTLTVWNGRAGDPRSFDRLEALLAEQAYRLAYWRVASEEINYRRFFDINELGAIRVEDPDVFALVHTLVFRWMRHGVVRGLRIDHPDGLYDPVQYFRDVQAGFRAATRCADEQLGCYMVVEKILCRDERLRADWAVHGTTGYEFLDMVNRVFVDPEGARALEQWYGPAMRVTASVDALLYLCKKLIMNVSLSGELHVLARTLDRLAQQHRWSRDFTLFSLQAALRELIACFPVYRTYIRATSQMVSTEGRRHIEAAIHMAKQRNPSMDPSLFDFLSSVLLLRDPDGLTEAQRSERREFVMRVQQLTAPVMAKGLEDTAFYRWYPLASLNEVGSHPDAPPVDVAALHAWQQARLKRWPYGLSATSTHDTKRSEDVHARLNVLSEVAPRWTASVMRWQQWHAEHTQHMDGRPAPDANEAYLLYQTLVGLWPLEPMDAAARQQLRDRVSAYMVKAVKEAKLHTSWLHPNTAYEQAVEQFVTAVLQPSATNRFLHELEQLVRDIALAGAVNALAQMLVKLTAPGVPDCFQGTELWHFRLVDPDNRQPVDFPRRQRVLAALHAQAPGDRARLAGELLAQWRDGRIKLHVLRETLALRARCPEVFRDGAYVPVEVRGPRHQHVCAFLRQHNGQRVLVVVPRCVAHLADAEQFPVGRQVWQDTALLLPADLPRAWRDIYDGGSVAVPSSASVPVGDVLRLCPVAALVPA